MGIDHIKIKWILDFRQENLVLMLWVPMEKVIMMDSIPKDNKCLTTLVDQETSCTIHTWKSTAQETMLKWLKKDRKQVVLLRRPVSISVLLWQSSVWSIWPLILLIVQLHQFIQLKRWQKECLKPVLVSFLQVTQSVCVFLRHFSVICCKNMAVREF